MHNRHTSHFIAFFHILHHPFLTVFSLLKITIYSQMIDFPRRIELSKLDYSFSGKKECLEKKNSNTTTNSTSTTNYYATIPLLPLLLQTKGVRRRDSDAGRCLIIVAGFAVEVTTQPSDPTLPFRLYLRSFWQIRDCLVL